MLGRRCHSAFESVVVRYQHGILGSVMGLFLKVCDAPVSRVWLGPNAVASATPMLLVDSGVLASLRWLGPGILGLSWQGPYLSELAVASCSRVGGKKTC